MNHYSRNSQAVLDTLHPDLKVLMRAVLQIHDHSLTQGHRTEAEHNALLEKSPPVTTVPYSGTMHRFKPSLAVDAIPYIPGRDPWSHEQILYFIGVVVGVADMLLQRGEMAHRIRVGADWDSDNDISKLDTTFFDGPHIELVGAEAEARDQSK